MKSTEQSQQMLFYQHLGELFYSIAASDKVVRAEEYDALKKIVVSKWKAVEKAQDPYKEPTIYQMEIVFEWFDYERMDAQSCFENFIEYATEYPTLFTEENIDLIMKTADAIASAFSGKNKSELVMLAKLRMFFNNINSH